MLYQKENDKHKLDSLKRLFKNYKKKTLQKSANIHIYNMHVSWIILEEILSSYTSTYVPGLGVCMTIFKSDMCLLTGAHVNFRFSLSLSCTVGDTVEMCIFVSFFWLALQHFQPLVQSEIASFGDQ